HLRRSGSRPPKGRVWRGSPARRKARRKVQQLSTINSCHNDRGKPCFSTAHRRRGTPGCDTERLLCSRHGSAATDFLSSERLKKPSELSAKARRHNGAVKGKPRDGFGARGGAPDPLPSFRGEDLCPLEQRSITLSRVSGVATEKISPDSCGQPHTSRSPAVDEIRARPQKDRCAGNRR